MACLLLALAGCDRPSEPPPAPPPVVAADATARTSPPTPISARGVGRDLKAGLPSPKAPKLGPAGPSTVRTTSAQIYLRNLEARAKGLAARLERQPDEVATLARLAAWQVEKRNLDGDLDHDLEAERLLGRAIAKADSPALRKQRASVRAHLHRFSDARVDLEAAIAADPLDADAKRALGWNLHHAGRHAEAAPLLEIPFARPRTYEDYGVEAVRLFEAGRIEEADARLRLAHGSYSDVHPVPVAWIDLQRGLLRLRTGRYDEARAFFRAAYDRLPSYYVVAEHLAETEALLGNHAAALALYDEVVRATRLPEFIAARAGVLRDLGRAEEAAAAIQAADVRWRTLIEKHGAAVAAHAVSFWLEDLPRPADARRWAEANLERRRDPASIVLAARARAAARDSAGARELLAEVEGSTMRVDEIHVGVADAWHRLGETDRARAALAKARALNPKVSGAD